ncbi:2-hydroxychromene-2-carboxylate isomerase [Rubrobacter indicoceani]|uniref:2-hydroxychromene-2-carboxylate isomerase n=1 Tax=Rubrobacter indicoceani TaxID=2051957 RepID=UPI000E5B5F31|nr:2-hydroxychromene-2-carboxylate isomerase [Rubrobacter indicoceani]
MGRVLDFYYDLVSPYSYLAYRETVRVCEKNGAELALHPVLLGAVHKLSGNHAPIETPAKGRYQMRDIRRWAGRFGLAMDFPRPFPFRTVTTMRAAVYCESVGKLRGFTDEGFRLYWEEGGYPEGLKGDEAGPVSEICRRIGLDAEEVLAAASSDRVKEGLKERTGAAVERGVFGTPTFFVGDEMFWGNDRLLFVEEALRRP